MLSKSLKTATARKNESKNKVQPPAVNTSIPTRERSSHVVHSKQMSSDKCTMTEFVENERKLPLESSVLKEQPYRYLQWTDPRLLRKYSMPRQVYRKSLTIPCVNKSEYGSEVVEDNHHSDDEDELLLYSEDFLFKCLYYFCTASVSFIGSMCGLTLVTVVLWKILNGKIPPFHFDTQKQDVVWWGIVGNFAGSVVQIINTIIGKIVRMLTISTSKVFAEPERNERQWYHILY